MLTLPPPPPALELGVAGIVHATNPLAESLTVDLAAPAWIAKLGGLAIWQKRPDSVRIVAVCWPRGAAPQGWAQIPGYRVPCYSPDATSAGQLWRKRLDAAVVDMQGRGR